MTNKAAIAIGVVVIIILAVGLPYVFKWYKVGGEPGASAPAPLQAPSADQAPSAPAPSGNVVWDTPAAGSSQTPWGTQAPGAPAAASASIAGFAFSPASLTVKKGATVTWTNQDSAGHTVTGEGGGPSSQLLNQGQKYSFTFGTVGTFPYHCAPHPFMTGTVTVTE